MHHFAAKHFLEHVFRGQQHFDQRNQEQYGEQMPVGPHLGFVVRMPDVEHTSQTEEQRDENDGYHQAHDAAVEPVVVVAVTQEIGYFEQKQGPEQSAQPVDAQQREFLDDAEVARAAGQDEQVNQHDAAHEPLHAGPVEIIGQPG